MMFVCMQSDKLAMIHNTEYSEIQEMLKLKETIQWTQVNPIPLGPLKLYTLQNNGCKIGCAFISPSREQLAAGLKNEINLWNLTPKRFLVTAPRKIHLACDPPSPLTDPQTFLSDRTCVTMQGHTDLVKDVMFMSPSNSDNLLFSVSKDATMRVWNLYNNTCAAIYRGHAGGICSIAQSMYGLYIATGSQDRTVKLWTADRVFHLRNMVGHELDVEERHTFYQTCCAVVIRELAPGLVSVVSIIVTCYNIVRSPQDNISNLATRMATV
uniref:Uncharacterized protein n=1 Tax=Timema tahoe TaxID=61484 RepID=A0A7R9IN33_9NEOP|nr:unnamed protein product [Timema tahoe]